MRLPSLLSLLTVLAVSRAADVLRGRRVAGTARGSDGTEFYDTPCAPLPVPDEFNMGVTKEHYAKLQSFANRNNVALFIRISDKSSLRLVQDGAFACKSMDVHDKSSNWGPMRGAVPVDVFFNKKLGGDGYAPSALKPDPDVAATRAEHISHAVELDKQREKPTGVDASQLTLSEALFNEYLNFGEITPCSGDNPCGGADAGVKCVNAKVPPKVNAEQHTLDDAAAVAFCMIPDPGKGYKVSWHHKTHSAGDALTPLLVWSYNGAPVTGDYDLWMVAPHRETPLLGKAGLDKRKALEYLSVLSEVSVRGGSSTMTPLINDLVNGPDTHNLNKLLGRSDKPVFHHGAEAQNHYFLQPLDESVAAIVPEDKGMVYSSDQAPIKSGPCDRPQLARLLAALHKHGFFVQINPLMKASVFKDPHFSGVSAEDGHDQLVDDHPECKENKNCPLLVKMRTAHFNKIKEMRQFTYRYSRNIGAEWWNEASHSTVDKNNQVHKMDTSEDRLSEDCVPPHIVDMKQDAAPPQMEDYSSPSQEKWGAVEYADLEGAVVGGFGHKRGVNDASLDEVCGKSREYCFTKQYCRRMVPLDQEALAGPLAMNSEAQYSQFVVLNRLIAVRQASTLARFMTRRRLEHLAKNEISKFSDTDLAMRLHAEVKQLLKDVNAAASFEKCMRTAVKLTRSGAGGGDADSMMEGESMQVSVELAKIAEADTVCPPKARRLTLLWRALKRGSKVKDAAYKDEEFILFELLSKGDKRKGSKRAVLERQMTLASDMNPSLAGL